MIAPDIVPPPAGFHSRHKCQRDRENPRRKLGRDFVAGRRLMDADDEDILGQILRLIEVIEHPVDHVDDGMLVFLDQFFKSVPVPVFGSEHQRGIGIHGARRVIGFKLMQHRRPHKVAGGKGGKVLNWNHGHHLPTPREISGPTGQAGTFSEILLAIGLFPRLLVESMRSEAQPSDKAKPASGGLWSRVLALTPLGKSGRRRAAQAGEFRSAEYWEDRYKTGGRFRLISAPYRKLAAFKAQFINGFIREQKVKRLLDFGCGDGNQASFLDIESYLGFDVSASAIERCRERSSKAMRCRRFCFSEQAVFRAEADAFKADLAMSMDVIFHLVEEEVFAKYMENLFSAATRHVIIYSTNFDKSYPAPHQG